MYLYIIYVYIYGVCAGKTARQMGYIPIPAAGTLRTVRDGLSQS